MPPHLPLETLFDDTKYIAEQKIDGKRMMIEVVDREAKAYNRTGEHITLPTAIAANFDHPGFTGTWIFDGEYLDSTYFMFDVLEAGQSGIQPGSPYKMRRGFLESLLKRWSPINIHLVPSSQETSNEEFFNRCKAAGVEGVVFKKVTGKYYYGKRTLEVIKYKFVETVDVIVDELYREGKMQSIGTAIFHQGKKVDAGGCKIPVDMVDKLQVGDVIEVKYLYASEDHKLVQPSFLFKRDDKLPYECTTDQLKYVNKTVLDSYTET